MGLFRDIIQKEISNDKMKLEATTFKEQKEKKEKKEQTKLINLSPRTKKVEEHKMNRDKSVENFVKYSWSWTI